MVNITMKKRSTEEWLKGNSIADIVPPPYGDGIVNFLDFSGQWFK